MDLTTLLSFLSSHVLELVTLVVSLIWLYLEYRASIWLWPVGIILPLLWIPICYQSHLYGMLAINIYYLVTSVIGWIAWLRKGNAEGEEVPISNIPAKAGAIYLAWPSWVTSLCSSSIPSSPSGSSLGRMDS
jgi:transporter, putative